MRLANFAFQQHNISIQISNYYVYCLCEYLETHILTVLLAAVALDIRFRARRNTTTFSIFFFSTSKTGLRVLAVFFVHVLVGALHILQF